MKKRIILFLIIFSILFSLEALSISNISDTFVSLKDKIFQNQNNLEEEENLKEKQVSFSRNSDSKSLEEEKFNTDKEILGNENSEEDFNLGVSKKQDSSSQSIINSILEKLKGDVDNSEQGEDFNAEQEKQEDINLLNDIEILTVEKCLKESINKRKQDYISIYQERSEIELENLEEKSDCISSVLTEVKDMTEKEAEFLECKQAYEFNETVLEEKTENDKQATEEEYKQNINQCVEDINLEKNSELKRLIQSLLEV